MCPTAYKAPRRSKTDLLSRAHGTEIDWTEASWMLRGQQAGNAPFVYFIGEQPDGAIKIGEAADPIKRLRQLQTGNPRHLKVERLIYGARRAEALVHEYFREFAIESRRHRSSWVNLRYAVETEWFSADARTQILEVAAEITVRQRLDRKAKSLEDMERIIGEVMNEFGYHLKRKEPVRFLGEQVGYVEYGVR